VRSFLVMLALALTMPAVAEAGTVSKSGTTITWTGTPAADTVTIEVVGAEVIVTDTVATAAGDGCSALEPPDPLKARCPVAAGDAVIASGAEENDAITCGGLPCTLNGDSGNDTLVGGTGMDDLVGGEGTDSLMGGDSDDELGGGAGDDSLDGGAGGDHLVGGDGVDSLVGGEGVDALEGVGDADSLDGGPGTDDLDGGGGDDDLNGGPGVDGLAGGEGVDSLLGGEGDDTLDGAAGGDSLNGGTGLDVLVGGDGADTLAGGDDGDDLDGGGADDTLDGGTGDDGLVGGDGADVLDGSDGSDMLDGGLGPDVVRGGPGDFDEATYELRPDAVNVVIGGGPVSGVEGEGDDLDVERVIGGNGDDTLTGTGGNHGFDGGPGNDTISIRDGDADSAFCGAGTDTVFADLVDFVLDDCENVEREHVDPPPSPQPPASPPSGSPQPPPSPAPPPPPPATQTRIAATTVGGRNLGRFLRRGLRVRVTCPRACRATLRVVVSRRTARSRKLRSAVIARGFARLSRAGTVTAVVEVSAATRRRLKKLKRLRATLETRVTPSGGRATLLRQKLTLRRLS
jgi:Ca2+-binding RTX toxin-like protein